MKSKIRGINLLGFLLFLCILAVLVYAGGSIFTDRPGNLLFNREFSSSVKEEGEKKITEEIRNIQIKNISGSITVKTWDQNEILVRYIKRRKNPEVNIRVTGQTLQVDRRFSSPLTHWGSVDFILLVPDTIRLENLSLESVSGKILLEPEVSIEEVRADTVSGRIELLSGRNVYADSTSGRILTELKESTEVDLETISGRIMVKLNEPQNNLKLRCGSVSGSVEVSMPQGLSGEVRMESVSGSLYSEMDLSDEKKQRRSLRGYSGSGDMDIRLNTVSGSIKLTR